MYNITLVFVFEFKCVSQCITLCNKNKFKFSETYIATSVQDLLVISNKVCTEHKILCVEAEQRL